MPLCQLLLITSQAAALKLGSCGKHTAAMGRGWIKGRERVFSKEEITAWVGKQESPGRHLQVVAPSMGDIAEAARAKVR